MVEYKVEHQPSYDKGNTTTLLNSLAKSGWRVVESYTLQNILGVYFVLEREKAKGSTGPR